MLSEPFLYWIVQKNLSEFSNHRKTKSIKFFEGLVKNSDKTWNDWNEKDANSNELCRTKICWLDRFGEKKITHKMCLDEMGWERKNELLAEFVIYYKPKTRKTTLAQWQHGFRWMSAETKKAREKILTKFSLSIAPTFCK